MSPDPIPSKVPLLTEVPVMSDVVASNADATSGTLVPWLLLLIAGLLEAGWAIGLKYTHGFTRLWPSVFVVLGIVTSMYLLAVAARTLPIGTAYAVWVGIGTCGAIVLGMALLGEPATPGRLFFLSLLMISIVGLKFTSAH